jgi:small subunit ribosomal protein S17
LEEKCDDKKCFRHGGVKVRGERISGKIVSAKGKHTVVIERSTTDYLSKYKAYARGSSRISAHNPPCIAAKLGDFVILGETRKLSKTKSYTVIEIVKGEAS